ncbi:Gamma-glutamyl phosphate reductase 2 [Hyella patelloides LEGE 07179]|uniref:Gamma-glutamyl phosphate reductase n=1 Tax=Hyella patelloides LEGE 07179 TaxID=945734 RepID=A0A563VUB2_9CYAN|nr:glutamate-5-semialdehyde dehydrogenase [Hyella patelloides]VEP14995.1 Gamma-glutamyl phosphate reductase 2 [Hyella patelloides LEGE 07179]
MDSISSNPTLTAVRKARQASRKLALASAKIRRQSVMVLAEAIKANFNDILESNTLDLEMSREMAVSELTVDWLKLTPERLGTTVSILQQLAKTTDPTKRLINAPYQLEPGQTYSQLKPLGTIALIYEAFPELAAIATGMCLKTGNSLILRGCSTASNTNQVISQTIKTALDDTKLPPGCVEIISPDTGSSIQELVVQDRDLDLIIPYGRPSLVQQVAEQATAPVLRTAIGNCYLYWSTSGNLELIRRMVIGSHQGAPDAVNAIEKILIHSSIKPSYLTSLFNNLQKQGFELRGENDLVKEFSEYLKPLNPSEWARPYMKKIVAFRCVEDLSEAVTWINRYSSGHADCLVTESYQESRQFARHVDSALIYINASPHFERNPNCGEAVFLGMSNQKGYRQGLIGLETFTTVKQVVQG